MGAPSTVAGPGHSRVPPRRAAGGRFPRRRTALPGARTPRGNSSSGPAPADVTVPLPPRLGGRGRRGPGFGAVRRRRCSAAAVRRGAGARLEGSEGRRRSGEELAIRAQGRAVPARVGAGVRQRRAATRGVQE